MIMITIKLIFNSYHIFLLGIIIKIELTFIIIIELFSSICYYKKSII